VASTVGGRPSSGRRSRRCDGGLRVAGVPVRDTAVGTVGRWIAPFGTRHRTGLDRGVDPTPTVPTVAPLCGVRQTLDETGPVRSAEGGIGEWQSPGRPGRVPVGPVPTTTRTGRIEIPSGRLDPTVTIFHPIRLFDVRQTAPGGIPGFHPTTDTTQPQGGGDGVPPGTLVAVNGHIQNEQNKRTIEQNKRTIDSSVLSDSISHTLTHIHTYTQCVFNFVNRHS
jgi:hypothetical protein